MQDLITRCQRAIIETMVADARLLIADSAFSAKMELDLFDSEQALEKENDRCCDRFYDSMNADLKLDRLLMDLDAEVGQVHTLFYDAEAAAQAA